MKRLLIRLLALIALVSVATPQARAQSHLSDLMQLAQSPYEQYRGLALGAGMSFFNGQPYYLIHVAPQLQFGEWGFGIDGNVRIGTDGKLRKEDWNEPYDYLRWINYVSYGFPHDNLYVRVGGLEHASIGDGVIVSDYYNNTSYDDRRIGLAGRLAVGPLGVEGLTSDIFRRGLIAVRPFIRPFALTPLNDVWLLKDLEVGVTGAFDFDTNATRIIPNDSNYVTYDTSGHVASIKNDSAHIASPLTTFGADISTMLWKTDQTEGRVYTDYVKFAQFNGGFIIGARASFELANSILVDLKAERSLFRDQFIPNYYNSFYERDRYDDQARLQDFITKTTLLADTTSGNGNGFRVGGFFSVLQSIQLQASYSHLDNLPGKDWLDMILTLPAISNSIYATASYTRKDINGVADVIALDERSLLTASVSMKPTSFLILTAISRWTFTKDDQGHVHSQSMIEPRADFVFSF